MRYSHTEDDPVREAAELVANRRKTITGTAWQGSFCMNRLDLLEFGCAAPLVAMLLRLVGTDDLCRWVATSHLRGLDNHARYGYEGFETKGLCAVASE